MLPWFENPLCDVSRAVNCGGAAIAVPNPANEPWFPSPREREPLNIFILGLSL